MSTRTAKLTLAFIIVSYTFVEARVARASGPSGVWRGQWTSVSTGHRGPMRAVVRPTSDGRYQARFTGRFFVVIPFTYRTTLTPWRDSAGQLHLSAQKPLGPMLGNYRMDTVVTGNTLQGSFSAAGDQGRVQMRRIR